MFGTKRFCELSISTVACQGRQARLGGGDVDPAALEVGTRHDVRAPNPLANDASALEEREAFLMPPLTATHPGEVHRHAAEIDVGAFGFLEDGLGSDKVGGRFVETVQNRKHAPAVAERPRKLDVGGAPCSFQDSHRPFGVAQRCLIVARGACVMHEHCQWIQQLDGVRPRDGHQDLDRRMGIGPGLLNLADVPPDLGGAWVELEERFDVGELVENLDVGSTDDPEAESSEDVGQEEQSNPDANGSRKTARPRKRKRDPKQPATSSSRPPPAAPANQSADASTLLADARKALADGQSRKAYSLASKSRSAKRTSAALIVMAKAACRFGGESQAKSAFNQLSVTNRRGLRAECRNHGVRLGL